MNLEKSASLKAIYPPFFDQLEFLDIGDGWFVLLAVCISEIKKACEKEHPNIKATQIIEKFGTLRLYTNATTDLLDEIIEKAEAKSKITCEQCGQPGTLRKAFWFYVSCDSCDVICENKVEACK